MAVLQERFDASNRYGAGQLAVAVDRGHPIRDSIRRVDGKLEIGWPSLAEDATPETWYYRLLARNVAALVMAQPTQTFQDLCAEGGQDVDRTLGVIESKRSGVSKDKVPRDDFINKVRGFAEEDATRVWRFGTVDAVARCEALLASYEPADVEVKISAFNLSQRAEHAIETAKVKHGGLPSPYLLSFYLGLFNRGSAS